MLPMGTLTFWCSVKTTDLIETLELRRNFQECGILTSVNSDEPVQPPLSLETPNYVQSVA